MEGIRLAGIEDITAMKISAIVDNGTRLKDFVDIACLSEKMTLREMCSAYGAKYPKANLINVPKALLYFEDIDFEEPIRLMNGAFQFEAVGNCLNTMVKFPDRKFGL